jgi:hypothetical protein
MNYFHEQKLKYCGMTRTGSRYVHTRLQDAFGGHGPVDHSSYIDPEYSDYTFVCSVRNPYARVLSGWKWLNMVNENKFLPDSFPDYVRCVVPSFMLSVCTTLSHHIEDVDHFIRIENVKNDLEKITIFPKDLNEFPANTFATTYRYSMEEYYAEKCVRDRIWDVYREDFERFGYLRDSYVGK